MDRAKAAEQEQIRAGVRQISAKEAGDILAAAGWPLERCEACETATAFARDLEWCATAACNASWAMTREEGRYIGKVKTSIKTDRDLVDKAGQLAAEETQHAIALKEEVVEDAERRHRVAILMKAEAGGGPRRVFALHLYRAVKKAGWDPMLSRGPFADLACKAWQVCFPMTSPLATRTAEGVFAERGKINPQRLFQPSVGVLHKG